MSDDLGKVLQRIPMLFCTLTRFEGYVYTEFLDGTTYGAVPHHTPEYHKLSARVGCVDVHHYCWQHEFCHSFLPEVLYGRPSRVLWALAHSKQASTEEILSEEALVVMFQAFMNRGIHMAATAPGLDWEPIREKALEMIASNWT